MLKQNGYAQYQNSRIMTASPAELTLMLYEGAIKFGNIAIMAMQNNEPAKAHENVVKVEKIIQNFRDTLDKKYPVWEDFEKVYTYLLRRCHEANIAKDPEIMEEVEHKVRVHFGLDTDGSNENSGSQRADSVKADSDVTASETMMENE